MLTTLTYALRRPDADQRRRQGHLDHRQPGHQGGPRDLKALRWDDDSMGTNFLLDWGGINQAFAAGQIGMYMGGRDVYTSLKSGRTQIDPDIYGLTTLPARPATRTPASSAAARWPRSTSRRPTPSGGRGQVDRLLLHAEAARPGRRRQGRQDARPLTASRSARRRCRSSTRRRWTSPSTGSRTTSTCRSTR